MIDLATFQIVRAPRRAEPQDDQRLELSSALIQGVEDVLANGGGVASSQTKSLFTRFKKAHGRPLGPFLAPASDREHTIASVGDLDIWLARADDSPAAADLVHELAALDAAYTALGGGTPWKDALKAYAAELASWILIWTAAKPPPLPDIARATRLALVTSLALLDDKTLAGLANGDAWRRLNSRIVALPQIFVKSFDRARVDLVRDATVADLSVVRSEWRAYLPGEIALIRNVMPGETYEAKHKQLGETEITATTETTTTTQQQTDTETQDQTEMSRDVQTQIQVAVQGQLQTNYEQTGTGNKFSLSAGVSAGVQVGHTEHTASRVAHQAVSKAISSVETTTRESRVQRQLTRTTDTEKHGLRGGTKGVRGVYRWVDRVDRYQVFTYPDRLQLEFELPAPAEYVRWRTRNMIAASQLTAPPDFTVTHRDITPKTDILALAKKYHATNLPVLPDELVSVVASKTDQPANLPEDPSKNQWSVPTANVDIEMTIPDGYSVYEVEYSGFATPLRSNWEREYTDAGKSGGEIIEAFHTIVANVYVASAKTISFQSDKSQLSDANSIQGPRAGGRWTQFGQAGLNILSTAGKPISVQITPPATAKLTVSADAQGAASLAVTFIAKCQRTSESVETWRNAVYDALFNAWSSWSTDYQNAQARSTLTGTLPVGESSPERNLRTVRDELKRQVISWLLSESPFKGRNGLKKPTPAASWRQTDPVATRASAATIQFMEEAFEWNNISYMFYPYYWADASDWDELSEFQGVDPDFERFLKAGSARVVVPARPGMERAVHHWLIYQEPFLGLPMPVPGDPMFVSVATEIHDMTQPPDDGIAGESWDALIGTTFLWLDTAPDLPTNPVPRLGQPPNDPTKPLVPLP